MNSRVLVVDDDPDQLAVLSHMICAEGMRAETVPDGYGALTQVMRSPPDLIVLDVLLPDIDGFAVCEQLKGDPATAMIPVVLVTALEDNASRLRGIRAGADDFLSKPVRREELMARVHSLRRLHDTRRELEARRLAAEVQRKDSLRRAFERYISPRVADRILADVTSGGTPFQQRPERVHVVALFADLRGFTRLTERLPVDEVVGFLNEYFAMITNAAYRHEGTIFSMAGDNLLIGFNVPFPQPDAPLLAWRAAGDMAESVAPVLGRWSERAGLPTGIGFGVASGDAIIGNIGSPHYMSYTIIGDAVNIAARLVDMARPGELLMSGGVYGALRGELGARETQARGRLGLRGRTEAVDVYSVSL